jgi:hypothetical protein
VLVIVVAAPCSWLAVEIQRAKNQKEAVKRIEKLYGPGVPVGYAVGNPGGLPGEKPIGPTWLRNIVGDHFFAQVFVVHLECSLVTDAELHRLKSLDEPSFLDLRNTQVTDAGMESLKGLTQLQELALEDTRVTEEGVRKLRQALPNCEITWEPPTKDERQSRASLDQTGG